MKIFIICVIFLCIGFKNSLQYEASERKTHSNLEGIIENIIRNMIESSRRKIPDPVHIDNLFVTLPDGNPAAWGNVSIKNANAVGQRSFEISNLQITWFNHLHLTIKYEKFTFNTEYGCNLIVMPLTDALPVNGSGNVNVMVSNFAVSLLGAFSLTTGFSGLQVHLALEDIRTDIDGINNDPEFSKNVSELLRQNILDVINNHGDELTKIISPILEKLINGLIFHKVRGGDEESRNEVSFPAVMSILRNLILEQVNF